MDGSAEENKEVADRFEFLAACRQPRVFCIITEYLSEGSLRAYLHKLEDNTRKERTSSVRKA
ncbi:putative protein kinase TKL-Pl-4 family [Helianthus annuus]|uniref:Protein kinase domain-containing protein n=1 Tax=Helianthus annuus TaxID=4232 RepID=A0A9K3DQH3_HELAN|nr:putative protein kinase TKL-Pl-4 family [Helianthus annuus]KAJ0436716.1 putative protein kinase TKL-Pl-4 family [Helianthus annuus]KAJ0440937.1 putative protein kinase TKL-Pl-4 family [Helianthus annuus]KAJ0459014.1 putative protein kinase TKL-Pl-4 family [Helianthus annuus]